MSKCPQCGEVCRLPDNVQINFDSYGGSARSVTECCGKIVAARAIHTYAVSADYKPDDKFDDWGRKSK